MTTFEITIIVLLAAIVVLLIVLLRTAIKGFDGVWHNQVYNYNELRKIVVDTSQTLSDIIQQLDNIENSNDQDFEKLTDIVDKMHKNLCVEIADKMVDRVYKQPTSVNGTPCYAPDGPCRDCINCPKKGTGGTWSTNISIKAEDAPLQEMFNDDKEA